MRHLRKNTGHEESDGGINSRSTSSSSSDEEVGEDDDDYDPESLDNPELRSGRHRTVITLASYLVQLTTSVI